MRKLFVAVLLAGSVLAMGAAKAWDGWSGCGPGCHSTISGACVVDGWGTVRNECPAGSRPLPPCPYGTRWRHGACIAT
jgi:hypothetical protein